MESIHVGTPPDDFNGWETKLVYFHNFLELSDARGRGNVIFSDVFSCFGHRWGVGLYPGGSEQSKEGYVSIYLGNLSPEEVTIDWIIELMLCYKGRSESCHKYVKGEGDTFPAKSMKYGTSNFVKRSWLQKRDSMFLDNGCLAIKVSMRLHTDTYTNTAVSRHCTLNNMEIFLDEETSDISFDVKGKILHAHKCIIKAQAKEIHVLCEAYSKTNPMPISDVDGTVFEIMLRTLYGAQALPEEWKKHYKEILDAAGKYGFDSLKSEAEVWYSKSVVFTVDNVVDEFLKADGSNYETVRKAAKKFMLENGKEVVASDAFNRLYDSKDLVKEIMTASFENGKKRRRRDDD